MTDLEHLHLVHETLAAGYRLPRRGGYTYYQCHFLCGTLLVVEDETIPVFVQSHDRIRNFEHTLLPILHEYNIEVGWVDRPCRRIYFNNNSNKVKFITEDWLFNPRNDLIWEYPDIDPNGFGVEDLD